jgi:hypothetical protein
VINWKPYDGYKWGQVQQAKMSREQKAIVERIAIGILALRRPERAICWGTAHPPGRHTQTVIRLASRLRHRYAKHGPDLGLKIFKIFNPKNDCPAMAAEMVKFHRDLRHLLPGLPHDHVQEVHAADIVRDATGAECHYLIQQWIEGDVLEDKIKAGFGVDEFFRMADDLFLKIIIPLWSQGTAWWDVRDSNYVFTPQRRLVMIDSDTLGQDAAEITAPTPIYTARNSHKITAMIRYRSTIGRMAGACLGAGGKGRKGQTVQEVRRLFTSLLSPVFCESYPLAANWKNRAGIAYRNFKKEIEPLLGDIPPQRPAR